MIASPTIRVDDGIAEGSEISIFYDPMIAKLVTHGPTRAAAIDAQIAALDAFEIEGIGHNLDFLSALMQHPRFRAGALTTGFIAEEFRDGFHGAATTDETRRLLLAVAALLDHEAAETASRISGQLDGTPPRTPDRVVVLDGDAHEISVARGPDCMQIAVDGEPVGIAFDWHPGRRLLTLTSEAKRLTVKVKFERSGWRLTTRGATHRARVYHPRIAALARHMIEKAPPDLSRFLLCPMPGLLTALNVQAGDRVEAGQPLAVVEAMKMENVLRAEKSAIVAHVHARPGDSLAVDAAILEFEGAE